MQNSKLIQYLALFTSSELRQFQTFVESPYFNKHRKTTELLAYILKCENWQSRELEKKQVFKQLFAGQNYDPQLLSNLISYLLRLLRQFLIQQQLEARAVEQQLSLMESCFHNGQEKLFSLTAGRLEKTLEKAPIKDSEYFLQQSRYQTLLDDFDLNFGNRSSGQHLEQAMEHFDTFFISKKLKMVCQVLARNQVTARPYSLKLIAELLPYLEKKKSHYQQIPSVWLYYLIYKMITQQDAQYYHELKKRLPAEVQSFSQQEGRDLYTHSLNYCIRRINFGESNFRRETLELYQQMLESNLLLVDGIISQWDYTNIVSLGCLLEEYGWVKDFIHQQKEQLPKGEKENTFTYNLAAFYYSQKEFDQALLLLREVVFTEIYYNLITRILTVKIYFDQEDWLALEYELEKFRIYLLRNNQITDDRRKSGLNLLRFTKSLMNLASQYKSSSKKEVQEKARLLQQRIEDKAMVMNKAWLIQKLALFI